MQGVQGEGARGISGFTRTCVHKDNFCSVSVYTCTTLLSGKYWQGWCFLTQYFIHQVDLLLSWSLFILLYPKCEIKMTSIFTLYSYSVVHVVVHLAINLFISLLHCIHCIIKYLCINLFLMALYTLT